MTLPNIDWENYNDVWDVYANNNLECSDPKVNQNNGKVIKVYGWLIMENNKITITNDSIYALFGQREFEGRGSWTMSVYCTSEIQAAIATYDLTRKSYIEGELKLEKIMEGKGDFCCQMAPRIILKRIVDICFE